jgi:hypothetical protein
VDGPSVGGGPDALADGPGTEEAAVREGRVLGPGISGGPEGLGVVAVAHDDHVLLVWPRGHCLTSRWWCCGR